MANPRDRADRLRQIEAVTDTVLSHLSLENLLHELLERTRELLDVDTATVLLHDEPRGQLVPTASVGFEEEVRQGARIPVGEGFAGTIAAEQTAVRLDEAATGGVDQLLPGRGGRSLLGVPMLVAGDMVGVLHVGVFTSRSFSDHDVHLLRLVADRMALAVQANVSHAERAATTALQRSLLPAKLPVVPGASLDARYAPGEDAGVGGDWYDVFALPSGHIGIVIGDVVGHGLPAAVVMGRLRSALRAYALETDDPGRVLDKLDAKVTHFEPNAMATLTYAIFDPTTRRLRLSTAGHPTPVLAVPGHAAAVVDLPVDPPVGSGLARRPRQTQTLDLAPGATICFYTDGLVESREAAIDVGLKLLCTTVDASPSTAVCSSVMSALVGAIASGDDIALLVLSIESSPDE